MFKKAAFILTAIASLVIANRAHAQIDQPLSTFEKWYGGGFRLGHTPPGTFEGGAGIH